jgi:hypothetical protein
MTTENTQETELTAELAKPEDISEYVEERQEQIAQDRPPEDEIDATVRELREKHPELKEAKKASRYERLKRARDQYKAESEERGRRLAQYETQPEQYEAEMPGQQPQHEASTPEAAHIERSLESARHIHGEGFDKAYHAFVNHMQRTRDAAAYQRVMQSPDIGEALVQWHNEMGNPIPEGNLEAEIEQGRQQQEFQQQLAARDEEIRVQTEAKLRVEAFAAQCPDFFETMQSVDGLDDGLSPLMLDLIRHSQFGPEIAYHMARDFWEPNSLGILENAKAIAGNPIAEARMIGQMEQALMTRRGMIPHGGMVPAPRATKAPPPLSPVRGGANAPKDIHSLARSDDASDYIRARRSAS